MADVRRREEVHLFTGLDTLAHPPGGAELALYRDAVRLLEQHCNFSHHLAQAAGTIKYERVVRLLRYAPPL